MQFQPIATVNCNPALDDGELVVWRIGMDSLPDPGPDDFDPARSPLSPDEIKRAKSFQFVPAARSFLRRRQALRAVLGRYLHLPPRGVDLAFGTHGKPLLTTPNSWLSFNMSDTKDVMMVALSRGGDIGIDIEWSASRGDELDVANSFFTPSEISYLAALPKPQIGAAFLRLWTRKEAVMKAVGLGLSLPPASFTVAASEAGIVDLPDTIGPLSRWRLHDLSGEEGLIAALATRDAGDCRLSGVGCSWKDLV